MRSPHFSIEFMAGELHAVDSLPVRVQPAHRNRPSEKHRRWSGLSGSLQTTEARCVSQAKANPAQGRHKLLGAGPSTGYRED